MSGWCLAIRKKIPTMRARLVSSSAAKIFKNYAGPFGHQAAEARGNLVGAIVGEQIIPPGVQRYINAHRAAKNQTL